MGGPIRGGLAESLGERQVKVQVPAGGGSHHQANLADLLTADDMPPTLHEQIPRQVTIACIDMLALHRAVRQGDQRIGMPDDRNDPPAPGRPGKGDDAIANGIGTLTQRLAGSMRRLQSGYVRNYALAVFLGVVVIIGYLILR